MIKYKAERLENSRMLAEWAVVGITYEEEKPATQQVYAWIPRWHMNAEEIAKVIAKGLNSLYKTQEDDYRHLNN
jgi:hypothetical protein